MDLIYRGKNHPKEVLGSVKEKMLDGNGQAISEQVINVKLHSCLCTDMPVSIQMSKVAGSYLLVSEFTSQGRSPVISCRFLKVGKTKSCRYINLSSK